MSRPPKPRPPETAFMRTGVAMPTNPPPPPPSFEEWKVKRGGSNPPPPGPKPNRVPPSQKAKIPLFPQVIPQSVVEAAMADSDDVYGPAGEVFDLGD